MSNRPWVLITGATSGIGLATAVLLALDGYNVIATGRTCEKLSILTRAAEEAKVTIRQVIADVSDIYSVEHLHKEVMALTNGYGVDILINNAGYAEGGAIEHIPLERLQRQLNTNVIGLVAVTQAFLPHMRERRRGRIINVSSIVGKMSIPLLGAYTATKHAVEAISESLRVELLDAGIQVVIIAPGSIQTNFGTTLIDNVREWSTSNSPYQAAYDKFLRDRGARRGAKPLVIAKVIQKAVSAKQPKARYAVPFDSKMMPFVKAIIPARTLDKILKRVVMGPH